MRIARTTEGRSVVTGSARPARDIVCAWCGRDVARKPLSGARLSHTICSPCIQKYFADGDSGPMRG